MGCMAPFAFWLGHRYCPAWKCFLTAKCACYYECAAATLLQIHPSAFQHAQNSSNSYEFSRSLLPAWDSSGIQLHRLNSYWSVHHPPSHHWTKQPHSISPPTESLFITQSIHLLATESFVKWFGVQKGLWRNRIEGWWFGSFRTILPSMHKHLDGSAGPDTLGRNKCLHGKAIFKCLLQKDLNLKLVWFYWKIKSPRLSNFPAFYVWLATIAVTSGFY